MFSNMACGAARYAGHPLAFLTAVLLVLIWAFTGPLSITATLGNL